MVPVRLRVGHRSDRLGLLGLEDGSELHRVLRDNAAPMSLPVDGVVLTGYLAEQLGVSAGDMITVEVLEGARPIREVAVAATTEEFIGQNAYMRLDALNRLMLEGPVHSGAYLSVRPGAQESVFAVLRDTPSVAGVSIREVAMRSFMDTMAQTLLIFGAVTTLMATAVAFGIIYNAARIAFSERARELASLRVLGYTQAEVTYILLGELFIITALALPLAAGMGRWLAWVVTSELSSDLFRVPLALDPSTYGSIFAVILVSWLLSAVFLTRRIWDLDLVRVLKTRE
jgi:putative ABC transport system permease protein